ncbi:tripeptidyl-peptidase-like protein [Podospora didyma]|uniref:tripeptidyl-peptidase II n=1 Tax=Podospora didyma TaxID=330526 RepID=A0AAE0NXT9_9PEZI|nr:tripeptidyl-peptidase-like protein [Podospora didyma]
MWHSFLMAAVWALSIAPSVNAAPTVFVEQTKRLPVGWKFHSYPKGSDTIAISVALRESNIRELKNQLFERHRRGRPDFGRHFTWDQVNQYRKPTRTVVDEVSAWLKSNGIRDFKTQGSLIRFDATVKAVKSLFQADLVYYSFGNTNKPVLRALSYTIPRSLRDDIDFVHPLTNFMPPHRRKQIMQPVAPPPKPDTHDDGAYEADLPCMTGTFPECIKKLYNITYTAAVPSPARYGVAGFLEQWISYKDVADFMGVYTPELVSATPAYNFSVELFNNGINPQDSPDAAGMEASLDVEYAMALGYPSQVTYYVTGGRGIKLDANGTAMPETISDNEPYLEFFSELLAKPDDQLPHVLSISYADDEQGVPKAYALRVCDMIAALTARGVSVLAATGDGGAAGTGQTQCISNDGSGRKMFMPTFPASCPFVTTVGATDNVGPPLTGADFSSGGFSDYFARPTWQDEVVGPYVDAMVAANDERLPLFNRSGRAMPDISAIGSGFQIHWGGNTGEVLGTSASTPTVAAMISLVNDARLRAGKPSLGWLNPLLYSAKVKSVLKDVTTGDSGGCRFPDGVQSPGWTSEKGYDCVTGLGTVNDFNDFLAALL